MIAERLYDAFTRQETREGFLRGCVLILYVFVAICCSGVLDPSALPRLHLPLLIPQFASPLR